MSTRENIRLIARAPLYILVENTLKLYFAVSYFGDFCSFLPLKVVSEYDQEIRQSQTVDKPMAPCGRAT